MEEEKSILLSQRREAEQEKLTIRDELVRLEQDRLELDSARVALHQSLQESELLRAGLEVELQALRTDRQKLQDKVTQVSKIHGHLCPRCTFLTSVGCAAGMCQSRQLLEPHAVRRDGVQCSCLFICCSCVVR